MIKNQQLLLERITVNPDIMVGKPTIRGLRITAEQILKALAAGVTPADLLDDYPELEPEDFHAVFLYSYPGQIRECAGNQAS